MTDSRQPLYPVKLEVEPDDRLAIEWNDSTRTVLEWARLRKNCPCAGCRQEREQPPPLFPIIKPEEAQPPKPRSIEPVGRYAYQIRWNDGHDSGIYTFEYLRELGSP
jgi:DUF971 family protein